MANYAPPLTHRPMTKEYDAGHPATFGRRPCKGCKGSMEGEPAAALWCTRCKVADIPDMADVIRRMRAPEDYAASLCAIEDCERPAMPGKYLCESCAAGCAPGPVRAS